MQLLNVTFDRMDARCATILRSGLKKVVALVINAELGTRSQSSKRCAQKMNTASAESYQIPMRREQSDEVQSPNGLK
jgi:hypothetical protein